MNVIIKIANKVHDLLDLTKKIDFLRPLALTDCESIRMTY